ncbi:hypothetical protein [Brevibacterium sp. UCMA 11754]|uniref:hypothetical protein n=1 Tax=Brevibacterium sp. UCMA 11754 TaxID=2749198 RepID=UPI001F2D3423|nr:hypothetical protein [Brevibacterium sp. UCMA 11754]MCF2571122.1 hypothetical protein [Brevibacterium sp. UCMA 11754]
MAKHLQMVTQIGDREASREAVLSWELTRLKSVSRLLGAPAPDGGDVDDLRRRLFELKRIIGPTQLQRKLRTRVRLGNSISLVAAKSAKGERIASSVKITVPAGSAEEFVRWFNDQSALPDSDAMLAACPDHYFIGEDDNGRQKVVETTGGSPLPTEFFIDYNDISSLKLQASDEYPFQIAGVARTAAGLPIGGVRHQFRNLINGGFESWNTVEFPKHVGDRVAKGHQWHLACEFGNWIEFHQARTVL